MALKGNLNRRFCQRLCESPAAKALMLVSAALGVPAAVISLLGVGALLHPPSNATNAAVPGVGGRAITPLSHPTGPATVQSSSGAQSPNVRSVQHDVKIQYGRAPSGATDDPTEKRFPIAPAPAGSTVQSSHGAQSPNVSGVGGNVDIQYGSPTAASTRRPPGSAK